MVKRAKNHYVKVTKRKRFVLATTTPATSTTIAPKPKWTHKIVEVKEVPVRWGPHMWGKISLASTENLNALIYKSDIESVVENIPYDSTIRLEPENVETNENEPDNEIPQGN